MEQNQSEGKGKRVVFLGVSALALIFVIIGAPGILLSTENSNFTPYAGCTAFVNAWKYWINCPDGSSLSYQVQDLNAPQWMKDRLRTTAAFEILSIVFGLLALILGIVQLAKAEGSKAIRLVAILLSSLASITLLISWGLTTTILQEWHYRWGFALLVTAFVAELVATLSAALFL